MSLDTVDIGFEPSPDPGCRCPLCKKHRLIQSVIVSRDPDALIVLVESLSDDWLNISEDRDYCRAVLNGSWPTAHRVLLRALAKAKPDVEDE